MVVHPPSRRRRRARRVAALAALTVLGTLFASPAATAAGPGSAADLTQAGIGPMSPVDGVVAPPSFDPLGGYPARGYAVPASYTHHGPDGAGILRAVTPDGRTLQMYCINLIRETRPGLPYRMGRWGNVDTPNLGYVARVVAHSYPVTSAPANLANVNDRAAAVQAAIWFFTDNFILASNSRLFAATRTIVASALSAGPAPQPDAPELTVSGPTSGRSGAIVGPLTFRTNAATVRVTVADGQLFSDAAGTKRIASGSSVPAASRVYVRSATPQELIVRASARPVARPGTVYIFDRTRTDLPTDAQELVLADRNVLPVSDPTTLTLTAPRSPAAGAARRRPAGPAGTGVATTGSRAPAAVPGNGPAAEIVNGRVATDTTTGSGRGALPFTGGPTIALLLEAALVLLATGGAVLATGRRRARAVTGGS